MKLSSLTIQGACEIQDDVFRDHRGAFSEVWDAARYKSNGLTFEPSNSCLSYNSKVNTLRGMHYQSAPFGQSKVVTCVAGKVLDVIVDLRKSSSTYLKWQATEMAACSGKSIYIPAGCAHGFLTLTDETVLSYLIEGAYHAAAASVVRWNDPAFSINWPITQVIISDKDKNAPDYNQ
jgi:dTDP-4-dehydrorhamnose 3,5-epimerase